MKKIYRVPKAEIIKISVEGVVLAETKWGVGTDEAIHIKEGDPTEPGVHFAKPHTIWDSGVQDAPSDWDSSWK